MQNKGLLTTFTILFAIAALFSLSLTFVANSVESNAKEYSKGNSDVEFAYLDSMSSEEVYPLIGYTYGELKSKMLNLGLDLKGGMNVTLEVQIDEVVRALSSYSKDITFNQAIIDAKKAQLTKQSDFVTLFGEAYSSKNPNGKLSSIFYTLDNKEKLSPNATNDEILDFIKKEADDAIDRSFNVLRTRISLFGAAEPQIQKLTGSDRILIELPGIKNKERVRQLLQGTAKLEFWLTYDNPEIYPMLAQADELLGTANKITSSKDSTATDSTIVADTNATAAAIDTTKKEKTASLLDKIESGDKTKKDTSATSAEDKKSFAEYSKEHPLFAVMRPAIYQDEKGQYFPGQGPVVGYVAIKDTGKVNDFLSKPEIKGLFPPRIKFLWTAKPYDAEKKFLQLIAIKVDNREGQAVLEGDVIVDASQQFDQFSGSPRIDMTMNGEGANKWKRITGENIGKSVAIALDNLVYSYPTVQSEIAGGQSNISGNFDIEEAKLIANILKAGKLPAPAKIIEENVVGPTLGQESIDNGMLSFIVALLVVLAYMVFYYAKAGIASVIALVTNMFFIFGILASMPQLIALTLPGLAGIILTIGMSVDANVLIFERIREEIRSGKGMRTSISEGYRHAYSSIIDTNVTAMLTGIILWFFGTGPIEGFAKTLVIGLFTSFFTAVFLTRLIFEYQLNKNKVITFSRKITENVLQNVNFDFMGHRKKFYMFSIIVTLLGIGSLAVKGLHKGVDFTGGRSFVVRFEGPVSTVDVSTKLATLFGTTPEAKTYGDNNQVKITTSYLIESQDESADGEVESKLKEGLASLNTKYEIMSSQKVGPTVADSMIKGSILSVLFSLLVMFLYIFFRFKKWQYGLGAMIALAHDVIFTISIFSIFHGILPFSLEIDQAFIAAILTVVGYSMHDTVVVFDRMREYIGEFKKRDEAELINESINTTLSRTINTSLTVFFVLLMMFIFGGEVIRGFCFALLIGVVIGTYSSIFVAAPITLDFRKKVNQDN